MINRGDLIVEVLHRMMIPQCWQTERCLFLFSPRERERIDPNLSLLKFENFQGIWNILMKKKVSRGLN